MMVFNDRCHFWLFSTSWESMSFMATFSCKTNVAQSRFYCISQHWDYCSILMMTMANSLVSDLRHYRWRYSMLYCSSHYVLGIRCVLMIYDNFVSCIGYEIYVYLLTFCLPPHPFVHDCVLKKSTYRRLWIVRFTYAGIVFKKKYLLGIVDYKFNVC